MTEVGLSQNDVQRIQSESGIIRIQDCIFYARKAERKNLHP
jgi:hypothetical protein